MLIPGYSLEREGMLRVAIAHGLNANRNGFLDALSGVNLELAWSVCGMAARLLSQGIPDDTGAAVLGGLGEQEDRAWLGQQADPRLYSGIVATATRGADRPVVREATPEALICAATLVTIGILREWDDQEMRARALDHMFTGARATD